jgi:protein gp37
MGETTAISWTDHTWNPWHGCTRVSPGCTNCYAEAFAARIGHGKRLPNIWGADGDRRFFPESHTNELVKWNAAAERDGVQRRVFVASMADLFEKPNLDTKDVDERARRIVLAEKMIDARATFFDVVARTPHLTYQLLTKRPENVRDLVPDYWIRRAWPKNVWLGTTVEDQKRALERIDVLLSIPARLRFLSCEPLLEHVDISRALSIPDGLDDDPLAAFLCHDAILRGTGDGIRKIGWVIVGGESGGGARPFQMSWARSIVEQCKAAGTPCFVKQLGAQVFDDSGLVRLRLASRKGEDLAEWPADLRVREFPAGARA